MAKHVQAVVGDGTHEHLRTLARRRQRPIKDLVREAVENYVDQANGTDPLDALIGSLPLGGDWSTRRDWRDPLATSKRRPRRG